MERAILLPGDPAPSFIQRTLANPRYAFDTAAGRYLVLCFFGTAADGHSQAAIAAALSHGDLFDDAKASFFGVSIDVRDESEKRVADRLPGRRFFLDFDLTASRLYGAVPKDAASGEVTVGRFWVVIDPTMRVLQLIPFRPDRSDIEAVTAYLAALPPPARFAGFELQAPVILLPNVFEPDLCGRLIDLFDQSGGADSGFMREIGGKTVVMSERSHKVRKDYEIADTDLIGQLNARVRRRISPEIAKVHQFQVTRMERYIVACYSAEDGGHFRPHRDNTTKGTAHRRFAVSINLNEDFDGGDISFPEYGPRGFRPPVGGALVFSCSLLHAVLPMTRGRRYAFLPFLYDEAAAKLREQNNTHLGEGVGAYKA